MIRFSQWQFNPENGALESDTEKHRLPPRLVKLLVILTENAPHLVEKTTLISEIWQDKIVNDDALARSIAELRRLLGDSSQAPKFIETVPRRGYRFIAEVRNTEPGRIEFAPKVFVPAILFLCVSALILFFYPDLQIPQEGISTWQTQVGNAKRFNADAQMEYQPQISPSGKRVAYGVREGEDNVVKIVDASGRDLYQIAEPGAWVLSPAWSPDESKIAVAIADSQQCHVYVVNLPELTRQRLSRCTVPNGSGILDWSADGKKIAFVARPDNDNSQPGIFQYDVTSGAVTRISVPPSDEIFDSRPRFSVDGESVYFLRGTRSTRDIYRTAMANIDKVERMTTSKNFKLGFALSHSGHEIVFDSNTNGDRNLWLLSLTDLAVKNLGARDSQVPSMTRHGQLLYQEVRYQANLWHFDLTSKQAKLLVDSPKYDNHPAISPDDRFVAYVSNRFGRGEIWLYDLVNGQDTRLFALNNADLIVPVWSAKGDTLLMSSRGDDGYSCYELHIDTREIKQIDGQGMALFSCQYHGEDKVLAINKTENEASHLLEITKGQVNILIKEGVNKAMPLSNGDIVYSLVATPGLHLLQSGDDKTTTDSATFANHSIANNSTRTAKNRTIIPDFPNHRVGNWTVEGDELYFLNPQNPGELMVLNLRTDQQSTLLQGLDVGVGNSIAIATHKNFAVISQRGLSQSNLFITQARQ